MYKGLIFTIGSTLLIIFLMSIYYTKKKYLKIQDKLYRYMTVAALTLCLTEILEVIIIYLDINNFLNLLFYRLHWFNGVIWLSFLYYYCLILIEKKEANSLTDLIKNEKTVRIMSILIIIINVIFFFIPFDIVTKENIVYVSGMASYYVLFYIAFIVLSVLYLSFKNRKKIDKKLKWFPYFLVFAMIFTYTLQFISINYSITCMGAVLTMYILYFVIENPDLKMIEDLKIVKQNIEKSNRTKSDFLSNMSHEIRSPMNAIVGFSQALLNDPNFNEESARSDITNIDTAGKNLIDIINNILDISKIESGNMDIKEKNYSISNIVLELTSIVEARLGNKPIKFITEVDPNLPKTLYGDGIKVYQILLNILTNSVKYTEVGKIKLTITGERINNNVNLHFKISDTGYGIKKEDYDKLFEKFSRLNEATQNEIEGTGLGLVITKTYVDLLKGKISFESEYEVGTTFYVDITQKVASDEKVGDITKSIIKKESIEYLDCSSKKVLLVDDNNLNLKVASRLLSSYKFNIETVTSGEECIYKIKEGREYDIIFMDHMMPEMDGIETLHVLKKLEGYKIPVVVALTANAITGMKEMYLNEGFDDYLSKPINTMELDKIINKYFNN